MTTESYTPFKKYFADAVIAKNLLAENYCKDCVHVKRDWKASKYRLACRLNNDIIRQIKTCEEWESNELMSAMNDI